MNHVLFRSRHFLVRYLAVGDGRHVAADREHADRIAANTTAELLPLPYAGHPVGPFPVEPGLLHDQDQELQGNPPEQLRDLRRAARRDPRNRDYRLVAAPRLAGAAQTLAARIIRWVNGSTPRAARASCRPGSRAATL